MIVRRAAGTSHFPMSALHRVRGMDHPAMIITSTASVLAGQVDAA
jgi:hypothetical protein